MTLPSPGLVGFGGGLCSSLDPTIVEEPAWSLVSRASIGPAFLVPKNPLGPVKQNYFTFEEAKNFRAKFEVRNDTLSIKKICFDPLARLWLSDLRPLINPVGGGAVFWRVG